MDGLLIDYEDFKENRYYKVKQGEVECVYDDMLMHKLLR